MKKLFFRTPYQLGDYKDPETEKMPSLTVPDQAEPITVLVQRLAQGLPVTFINGDYEHDGEHNEKEFDSPDIDRDINDLVDGQNFVRDVGDRMEQDEIDAEEARKQQSTPPTRKQRESVSGEERSERNDKEDSSDA